MYNKPEEPQRMDFRRLLFPGTILLYVLALWYLAQQAPYEAFPSGAGQTFAYWVFQISLFYIPLTIAYMMFFGRRRNALTSLIMGMTVVVFATQLLLSLYFFLGDIGSWVQHTVLLWKGFPTPEPDALTSLRFKQYGLLLISVPFGYFIYGITKGKYHYQVEHVRLAFPDLPEAFDGFRLLQISDIHSGSFDSLEAVEKGTQLITEQEADLIVFTGDLVNGRADEIEPFIHLFRRLEAPLGKYAVTGNHDYSSGGAYGDRDAWRANVQAVQENYRRCGFDLLKNRSVQIKKDGDVFHLVGVENWGKPPFPQFGDLDQALENTPETGFKILLSHDPSHWDEKVLPHKQDIHLTLSGHTHGMQFGINFKGLKWSPIQMVYPRWAGLYEEAKQFLYVNRGFGWLGFPGRIGMYPEITVFELQRAQQ